VIYPQYWFVPKVGTTFSGHLVIIQTHFGHPKAWGTITVGGALLNPIIFNEHSFFFKLTMQNHAQFAMLPPHDYNPSTCLWEKFGSSVILNHCFSKWFKLTKLCMVMVLGSVEDEHIFSNLAFIKTQLQNHLTIHMDLVVWMYVHKFYDLENFPFYLAIHD